MTDGQRFPLAGALNVIQANDDHDLENPRMILDALMFAIAVLGVLSIAGSWIHIFRNLGR